MNKKSREGELNSRLAECEQLYRRLTSVGFDPEKTDISEIPKNRHRYFATTIYFLLRVLEDVERLLKQITLDGALQSIARRPVQFYRKELAPNREQ